MAFGCPMCMATHRHSASAHTRYFSPSRVADMASPQVDKRFTPEIIAAVQAILDRDSGAVTKLNAVIEYLLEKKLAYKRTCTVGEFMVHTKTAAVWGSTRLTRTGHSRPLPRQARTGRSLKKLLASSYARSVMPLRNREASTRS